MEREEECQFVRLLPDGTLIMWLQGVEREVEIDGLEIPQPLPDMYIEIFQRVSRLRKPVRCSVRSVTPTDRVRARLSCYGWQDKSGDVWVDLALVLLEEGVVRVAAGEFPEREEYMRHESEARHNSRR